ncbi:TetR/AcrR family transcriptional regulator [Brevundimonas pishanensis]|uniref:TetR/AcrR family transcriptional regulator n=1 Tax=Brevundimonas pishanensis TaxID=2896315 RepID=UPI0020070557|nr:TetR/AcrR family transcriptional regulator [Brevundimonas pishanensis]
MRSVRKPKGEGHARRGEILAAAEQIFVAHGYEGATIRKIAEAVGLSSTALYLHFKDKAEILNEICLRAFSMLLERQVAMSEAEPDPEARLRGLMIGYVQFGFENANAYRLAFMTPTILSEDGSEPVSRKVAAELFQKFESGVAAAVEGCVEPDRVRALAQVLWASIHGLVSIIITKPQFGWEDQRTLIETQVDILVRGVTCP